MKRTVGAACVFVALSVVAGCGGSQNIAVVPPNSGIPQGPQDQAFMTNLAQDYMAAVTSDVLAVAYGSNESIHQLGQQLLNEHNQALYALKNFAQSKHVTLPDSPTALQEHENQVLGTSSGKVAGVTYLQDELKRHQSAVQNLQQELQSGSDPQVKAFAQMYLPIEQEHSRKLQSAMATVGQPTGP